MNQNLAGTITSLQAMFQRNLGVLSVVYRSRILYRAFNVDTDFVASAWNHSFGNLLPLYHNITAFSAC